MTLLDPTPHLHTLDDTAALLMSIDVLVSVDTSCVHLAGGLGRPVILLDRFDNCWRWLHGTPNSPWYPTLRIIRQTEPRQWGPVIAQLCQALTAMAHHKKDRTRTAS
ncbi:peptide transporter [Acetobacter orientalis]|nr:peptide transporter [Acetobacter orientalis]